MKKLVMIVFMSALLIFPLVQAEVEADDQYACVKKKNGQFRIEDDPEDCRPSEFPLVFSINSDSELEGEMCWTNPAGDCTLKLQLESEDNTYSFIGNEICNGGNATNTERHAYGSGYINNGEMRVGLTFTGLISNEESVNTGILHEGRVYVMDIGSGLGLVQYRESSEPDDCGENPVPCVIEEAYESVECEDGDNEED